MSELLIQSLWVTLFGMGLVFVAIVLFWWMMLGITALPFKDEEPENSETEAVTEETVPVAISGDQERKAQAAALAVTVALAQQKQGQVAYFPMPETALVSAWQLGMRTRQMYQKARIRR